MRNRCPGSGKKVAERSEAPGLDGRDCPDCNVPFVITKNGYLRAHSVFSKAAEAWEKSRKHRRMMANA